MFDIHKAKELCDIATPGPWEPRFVTGRDPVTGEIKVQYYDLYKTVAADDDAVPNNEENTLFISQARTLLPEAIAEIERLRRWLEEIKAESVWGDPGYEVTLKNKLGRIYEDVERALKGEPID